GCPNLKKLQIEGTGVEEDLKHLPKVLVAGGSLVLIGQSDTESPNSQLYTQIGGVTAIAGPFVETITS
ncbi:8185_t:CDS:2, partial [Diversispora eburnea]